MFFSALGNGKDDRLPIDTLIFSGRAIDFPGIRTGIMKTVYHHAESTRNADKFTADNFRKKINCPDLKGQDGRPGMLKEAVSYGASIFGAHRDAGKLCLVSERAFVSCGILYKTSNGLRYCEFFNTTKKHEKNNSPNRIRVDAISEKLVYDASMTVPLGNELTCYVIYSCYDHPKVTEEKADSGEIQMFTVLKKLSLFNNLGEPGDTDFEIRLTVSDRDPVRIHVNGKPYDNSGSNGNLNFEDSFCFIQKDSIQWKDHPLIMSLWPFIY